VGIDGRYWKQMSSVHCSVIIIVVNSLVQEKSHSRVDTVKDIAMKYSARMLSTL